MFHVPEFARVHEAGPYSSTADDGNNGAFDLDSCEPGWRLTLLCSDSSEDPTLAQWEHVSVHAYRGGRAFLGGTLRQRTPTWKEMCLVKRLCWDAEDVVMQLHPRESEYVNQHPHTLHLWRPIGQEIPTPPADFVGTRPGE